jgi:UDP-N-acetylmuramate dehydrogenase
MGIQQKTELKPYNTFGLHALAARFTEVSGVQQLQEVLAQHALQVENILILGGGSNMLFTKDFDGLVIRNAIKGVEVVNRVYHHVDVRVSAGENWHEFVLYCIANNYGGVENLSLIPGCVGAAPMQNIGAYGVEIKDVFLSLEAMDIKTGHIRVFTKNECNFGYRESVFKRELKNKYVITSVTFRLHDLNLNPHYNFNRSYGDIEAQLAEMKVFEPTLKAISDAVIRIRSSKLPDPRVLGNAGSFFKNPVIPTKQYEDTKAYYPLMPGYVVNDTETKVPAGWLIEQCGWKGRRVGNTGSHASQALVLVNYGGATGREVYDLALAIQQSVREKFNIVIEPEVNLY